GIENVGRRFAEDAAAHEQGGNAECPKQRAPEIHDLEIAEEERLVLAVVQMRDVDRTAGRRAILVVAQRRAPILAAGDRITPGGVDKEVGGVELLIAKVLGGGTAKFVGA